MTTPPIDHPWHDPLFGDAEIAALWARDAQIDRLVAVERALTEARASVGDITAQACRDALKTLDEFEPDYPRLAEDTARDGVITPGFAKQLREKCTAPDAIHTGATSQDIHDTATVLILKDIAGIFDTRLDMLLAVLDALADRFGDSPLTARTRMQAALPTRASVRIKSWRDPLKRHLARLPSARDAFDVLQLGGPVGDRQTLGPKAGQIAEIMAETLGLSQPGPVWHAERDRLAPFAAWMAAVAGTLGKIGLDVALMSQQGIAEIARASGGASSAMPHKSNPIEAECLVTLARHTGGLLGTFQGSLLHEQERSGTAWMLEWLTLPPLTVGTGAACRVAHRMLTKVDRIGNP